MKLDKVLSLLGLIARARKMITGEELVVAEIQKKRVHLVLLSKDASENTKKKIYNKCDYYRIPLRELCTREQLGHAIGKEKRVVLGISDQGFAAKLTALIDE